METAKRVREEEEEAREVRACPERKEEAALLCRCESGAVSILKCIFAAVEKIVPDAVLLKFTATGLQVDAMNSTCYATAFVNRDKFSEYEPGETDVEVWTNAKAIVLFKDVASLRVVNMRKMETSLMMWGEQENGMTARVHLYCDQPSEEQTLEFECSLTYVVNPAVFKGFLEVVKDDKAFIVHKPNLMSFEHMGAGGFVENAREFAVAAPIIAPGCAHATKAEYAIFAKPLKAVAELSSKSRDIQISYSETSASTVRFYTDFDTDDPRSCFTLYASTINPGNE